MSDFFPLRNKPCHLRIEKEAMQMKTLIGLILSPFLGLMLFWWALFLMVIFLPVYFLTALGEGIPAAWQKMAKTEMPLSETIERDNKISRLGGWLIYIAWMAAPFIYFLTVIPSQPN